MEFNQRSNGPAPQGAPAHNKQHVSVSASLKKNRKWTRILGWVSMVLLISIAVLLIAVVASFVFNKPESQKKYVNSKQMQAVFLNGGQVYFGNISAINSSYITLSNIYYLRVNQTVQPNQSNSANNNNDVSLVKLGCELHGPADQMVINQQQVIFWENLKDDGQVAKAVAQYQKQNPNGQNCAAAATPTNSSTPAKQ